MKTFTEGQLDRLRVAKELQIRDAPGPLNDARQLVGARFIFPGSSQGRVRTSGFNQEK